MAPVVVTEMINTGIDIPPVSTTSETTMIVTSHSGNKFHDLIMQENKTLREEARRARQERKTLQQKLESAKLESESQLQLLKAELKQKDAQNLYMRKEL